MDIFTGQAGWIEVVCGPMFSGKSEELIRRLRRARIARKRVQVFKPVMDDRYSTTEIVSHGDQRMPSEVVSSPRGNLEKPDWRPQVIGVDGYKFVRPGLVDNARQWAESGHEVDPSGAVTEYRVASVPRFADLWCSVHSGATTA